MVNFTNIIIYIALACGRVMIMINTNPIGHRYLQSSAGYLHIIYSI